MALPVRGRHPGLAFEHAAIPGAVVEADGVACRVRERGAQGLMQGKDVAVDAEQRVKVAAKGRQRAQAVGNVPAAQVGGAGLEGCEDEAAVHADEDGRVVGERVRLGAAVRKVAPGLAVADPVQAHLRG